MTFSNFLDIIWFFVRLLFGMSVLVFVVMILANVWKKDKDEDKDPEKDL
jgi:heme exporter protein D